MTKTLIQIQKGHHYFLRIDGTRVRVYVTDLIGAHYARVKHPKTGKIYTCGITQLEPCEQMASPTKQHPNE